MIRLYILCIGFLSLFISNAYAQEITMPIGDFSELRKDGIAKVVDVIDPLTIRLDDDRIINLVGIDYPDLSPLEPGSISVTAHEILKDFLKGQKVVIYRTPSAKKGRVNRMGHKKAHVIRIKDNAWTQGLLIRLGLARVRTTKYNPQMAKQMLLLEAQARKNDRGLWAMEDYNILAPNDAHNNIDSYQIIEGKIINASLKNNQIYLNFGQNWKDDFTVSIASKNSKKFTIDNLAPHRWSGKKIRVRGWIRSYNGPYIELDHPQRVEALFHSSSSTEEEKPNKDTKKPKILKGSALPSFNE